MNPRLVAHRGDTTHFQENSLEAFISAFDQGADGVELDVQLHNGKLVVIHDYLFDDTQEHLPLSLVFEKLKNRGFLEIEIKGYELEILPQLKKVVSHYNLQNFEIVSAEPPLVPFIQKYFPLSLRGLIIKPSMINSWMTQEHIKRLILGYIRLTQCSVIHLPLEILTSQLIEMIHDNNVICHTLIDGLSSIAAKKVKMLDIDLCCITDIKMIDIFNKISFSTAD